MSDTHGNVQAESSAETLQERANTEAALGLSVNSIGVARDFCRVMIGISSGGVGVYLAIVTLALGKQTKMSLGQELVVLGPSLILLLSAGVAAWGFLPRGAELTLNDPDVLEEELKVAHQQRLRLARASFGAFAAAVLAATVAVLYVAQEFG